MPGPHRRFLEMLTQVSSTRVYAMSHKADSPIRDAYNTALMALGAFRDKHIRMVTRYIVMPARMKAAHVPAQANLATSTAPQMNYSSDTTSSIRGTGGTDFMPFLKQTRDTTKATASYAD